MVLRGEIERFGPGRYHMVSAPRSENTDVALAAARERADSEFVTARLKAYDEASTVHVSKNDRESLVSGYELAAQGFLRYFETHGLIGR